MDPSKLPQRVDVELSDHAYEYLQPLSAKAELSIRQFMDGMPLTPC